MTPNIELTPTQEARLEAVARENGTAPEEFVKQLVADDLSLAAPAASSDNSTSTSVSHMGQGDARIEDLKRILNAIPEGRDSELLNEFLTAAQSGDRTRLFETILRWAEVGNSCADQDGIHPLAKFAGTFADDPVFAEVKRVISSNRRRDKTG